MKNNFKQKLKDFIIDSNLNDDQKKLWQLFSKISNSDEDEAVYEAVFASQENLELLSEHLRDKIWEIKENDKKVWEKLVDNEESYAEALIR